MRKRRRCFVLGGVVLSFCFVVYFPILLSIRPEDVEVWNVTQNLTEYVLPYNYTAVIDAVNACSGRRSHHRLEESGDGGGGDGIFLLVVVCSAVNNFEARTAIRDTWGSLKALSLLWKRAPQLDFFDANVTTGSGKRRRAVVSVGPRYVATTSNGTRGRGGAVRLVFMLGRTDNDTLQQLVLDEGARYGDIVQEDFVDTYNNLTVKSVMMLKWVNATCRQVRFVMKTDDDTFVNVPRLVSHLRRHGRSNLLLGCLICSAIPVKNKKSKWYTPRSLFNERVYPNYLSGTGYVISGDLVPRLYETALHTPFFHLEDIYITGLCARRLRIRPVDYEGFSYQKRPYDPCLYHYAITGHKVTPADTRSIWKDMHSKELRCDVALIKLRDFKPAKCFH